MFNLILLSSFLSRCTQQIEIWHRWIRSHILQIETLKWCIFLSGIACRLLSITICNRDTIAFIWSCVLFGFRGCGAASICVFFWHSGASVVLQVADGSNSGSVVVAVLWAFWSLPFSAFRLFGSIVFSAFGTRLGYYVLCVCSLSKNCVSNKMRMERFGRDNLHCCSQRTVYHMFGLQQWQNREMYPLGPKMVCLCRCS